MLQDKHDRSERDQDRDHGGQPGQDEVLHAPALHQVAQAVAGEVGDQGEDKDTEARHHRNPPLLKEIRQVACGVRAELRRGCGLAEAEERQRRHGEDQRADVQAGGDQRVGHRPGQQVAPGQPNRADAGEFGRLDVGPRREPGNLTAHKSCVERPPHDRHRDQRVDEARPQRGDHRDGQHRRGQRQERVGDPHQQRVDPSTGRAGDQADQSPDEQPDRDDDQCRKPTRADAVQHATQDVSADGIGAEQKAVVPRRLQWHADRYQRIVRGDDGYGHCHHGHQQNQRDSGPVEKQRRRFRQ